MMSRSADSEDFESTCGRTTKHSLGQLLGLSRRHVAKKKNAHPGPLTVVQQDHPFLFISWPPVLSFLGRPPRSESVCGAWSSQYEGLRITTRRAHCGLPGWPVPRGGGFCDAADNDRSAADSAVGVGGDGDGTVGGGGDGDEMSAEGFVRYLRAYRHRFDLEVFTDTEVVGAAGGTFSAGGTSFDGGTVYDGEELSAGETSFDGGTFPASWPAYRRGGGVDGAGGAGGIRIRYRR